MIPDVTTAEQAKEACLDLVVLWIVKGDLSWTLRHEGEVLPHSLCHSRTMALQEAQMLQDIRRKGGVRVPIIMETK